MRQSHTLSPPAISPFLQEAEEQQAAEIIHATLPGLLPDGYVLAIHRQGATVAILRCEPTEGSAVPQARVIHQQPFTQSELALLLPLVATYPDYCPNEVLLAAFTYGSRHTLTEEDIPAARKRLHRALELRQMDEAMKPVRNLLSRVRSKFQRIGITIASIMETGYQLMPLRRMRVSSPKQPLKLQRTKKKRATP